MLIRQFPWLFVSPGYFNLVSACGVGMDHWAPVIVCFQSPCDTSSFHYPCKTWTDLCRSLFAALIITAQPNTTCSVTNDSNLNWELMLTKHKLFSFCRGWSNLLWKAEALLDIYNQSLIDWGQIQRIGREADNQILREGRRKYSRSRIHSGSYITEKRKNLTEWSGCPSWKHDRKITKCTCPVEVPWGSLLKYLI